MHVLMGLLLVACDGGLGLPSTDPDPTDPTAPTGATGEPTAPPTDCVPAQAQQVCNPDDPTATYWADACGNLGEVADPCPGIWLCIDGEEGADATCGCADIPSEGRCSNEFPGLYGSNLIAPENVCGSVNTDPDDALEICPAGTRCETLFDGPPTCVRSIRPEQASSPYYDYSCGGFTSWLEHPTNLGADCRCRFIGDIGVDPQDVPGDGDVCDPVQDLNRNGVIMNCTMASRWAEEPWPLDYGSGQSFRAFRDNTAISGDFMGGVWLPDTRELVAVMLWTRPEFGDTGAVVAFQVDTGDRRIISGVYPDPDLARAPGAVRFDSFLSTLATAEGAEAAYPDPDDPDVASLDIPFGHFGSGYLNRSRLTSQPYLQPLSGASVVRLGPDGMLYVGGAQTGQGSAKWYEIVRVDPSTGHRELVWKSQFYANQNNQSGEIDTTYGQCFRHGFETYYRQSVEITNHSLIVASDGSFYVGFDDPRMGSGLLNISADGATCTFASRFGATERDTDGVPLLPPDIGGGYTPSNPDWFYGGVEHDGQLYFVRQFQNELVSFDPVTGDRTLVSEPPGNAYGGIGYMNMWWDPTRQLMATVGSTVVNAGAWIDITTGERQSMFSDGAGASLVHSVYPEHRDLTVSMLGAGNGFYRGAAWLDPQDPDLLYMMPEPAAMGVMELSTFNAMILSWDSTPATPISP